MRLWRHASAMLLRSALVLGTLIFGVIGANAAPLVTANVPDGVFNASYDWPFGQTFDASGGIAPYTYSIESAPPFDPGLTLDAATGRLSGLPLLVGDLTYVIRMTDANGDFALGTYTVRVGIPTPLIMSVVPRSGLPAGGTQVTMTGQRLTYRDADNQLFGNVDSVNFGGVAPASFSFDVATATVTATTPAHALGAVNVGAVSSGGTSNLNQGFVYAIAPTITGITPAFGDIAGYDSVTITGTDLSYGTDVTFDGVSSPSVQVAPGGLSANVLTPAHGLGLADVAVVNGSGSATLPGAFDYQSIRLTVDSVSPATGPTTGGNTVVLNGTNLSAVTDVQFDWNSVPFTIDSATQLTVTAPPHAEGSIYIMVSDPTASVYLSNGYEYATPLPAISAVSPSSGELAGGQAVTITGTELSGVTSVSFGGTPASAFVVLGETTLTATVPAQAAAGAVDVVVSDGSTSATLAGGYTYLAPTPPGTMVFSPAAGALPQAMAGEAYSQAIAVSGGTGALVHAVTAGALPQGMVLNVTTGALSGPLDAGSAGSYDFTVTATDGNALSASASYSLAVIPRAVTVQDMAVTILPGATPPPLDLTQGATGGPFTDAAVISVTPPIAGTAEVIMGEVAAIGSSSAAPMHFYLKFTPNPEFSGNATVTYTLTSALGVSNTGVVTFTASAAVAAVGARFNDLVHDFISTRQSLLSSAIDVPGLVQRRAMASSNRPGVLDVAADGNAMTMNFASSLAELQSWNAAGQAAATLVATSPEAMQFNFWIDGTATLHLRSDNGEDHWGNFGLLSVGGDYLVNDQLLVGLAVHADMMSDLTDTSSTSGKGVLVGPYLSAEVVNGVFLDVSLYYGHSWNEVSSSLFAGTFESQRVLAKARLEGEWQLSDVLTLRPNVTAFYLHEAAADYSISDGLGNIITLAGFDTEQFRLSGGGQLEYAMTIGDGWDFTPFVATDLGLSTTNGSAFGAGAYGMIAAGFMLRADASWTFGGRVELGLDVSGLKSVSARTNLSAPF